MVVVGVMTVVVVTHPSLPFALQQERQAVALCLHSDHARMNIWRASLRHERPERPGVQSPRADVRSACACVRQSSFCEAQDVLHSRQALSHLFLAASICEALTRRRTRASSVRRGQIRRMAPQARGPCLPASIMVGRPPVTAASHTSAIPLLPMAVVTMPPSRTSGLGPLAPPAPRCREASAGTRGHSGGQVPRSASMITITQASWRGGAPESTFTNRGAFGALGFANTFATRCRGVLDNPPVGIHHDPR